MHCKKDTTHSNPRNKRIAFVLHKCGYIEHWGRGIDEMIKGCASAGLPEPIFKNNSMEFKIIFPLTDQALKAPQTIKLPPDLTARQLEIMAIFISQDKPLKVKELQELLENRYIDRMLRRELNTLKEKGLIASQGHTNKTTWFLRKSNFGQTSDKLRTNFGQR